MKIAKVAIDKLTLDPQNARKHSEGDVQAIKASLERFGQQTPIVVANGVVVKGNGTVMAAMALGYATLDAIQTTLTGDQLRAYAIADNQTGLISTWDIERLREAIVTFEDKFVADLKLDLHLPPIEKPKPAKVTTKPATFSIRINGVSQADKEAVVDLIMETIEEGGYAYSAAAY